MKTDSLFYELFRQWPAVALDLAGLDPATAERYEFRAEELKQAAFRLDGLLVPADTSDDPYVFIEVQFQPDDSLYPRLFAELFLYLRRASKPRDWRVLVLYPDLEVERIPRGYELPVSLPLIHRLDLSALDGQDKATPGWELLRLIVDETPNALDRARRLLRKPATGPHDTALINFIETILVYKLPRSTREEIQVMLGITDIDLKQTRFYQDVHAEGKQEGKLEGNLEGRRTEAATLLMRLAQVRFGDVPAAIQATSPMPNWNSWNTGSSDSSPRPVWRPSSPTAPTKSVPARRYKPCSASPISISNKRGSIKTSLPKAAPQRKPKGQHYRVSGDLTQTDIVMNHTFWIGVQPALTEEMLEYAARRIEGIQ